MELEHFSHPEHPLSLTKEACLDEWGFRFVCYGCHTPIGDRYANSTFYKCATCKFYLHKRCAEAPRKIIYSKHSKHPLTLLLKQPDDTSTTCGCDIYKRFGWECFTYNCSRCRIDVDIICALRDMDMICDVNEDRSFTHDGHQHSLSLQLRPALIHCDACDTESKDFSYSCNTCYFSIHKKCALLPSTMKFCHHNHDLVLAYSFPKWYSQRYSYECDICSKEFDDTDWIYYCGLCRYFVHLNCAITTSEPATQSDDEDYKNLEKFPINGDRSAYLIGEFVKKNSGDCDGEEKEEKIQHWNHNDHPLILWDGQSNNSDIVYDGMCCAACMQPITSPFYNCSKCSYFIHRHCARLPLELRHEAHLDHPLKLIDTSTQDVQLYVCTLCRKLSSGFYYSCEICKISIGIGCISVPTKILHDSHRHPLIITSQVPDYICQGCHKTCSGFAYQCKACSYTLDCRCATRYPHTLTHDYDEHPIYLMYPPIENLSHFYCEICEDELHPKKWMYCCKLCRFYYHLDCLHDQFSGLRFGWTLRERNNPFDFTFIRNDGYDYPWTCMRCHKDFRNYPVFECNDFDAAICPRCIR